MRRNIMTSAMLTAIALCGCGTNFDALLLQSLAARGTTVLDLIITDVVDQVVDNLDQTPVDQPGDNDGPDSSDGPDNSNMDPPPDDLMPDTAAGMAFYAANGCGGCHCDDGSGGCALSAPPLFDVNAETTGAILRGEQSHPIAPLDISQQELADLESFFASLQ